MLEEGKVEGKSLQTFKNRTHVDKSSRIEAVSRDVRVMAVGKYFFQQNSQFGFEFSLTRCQY